MKTSEIFLENNMLEQAALRGSIYIYKNHNVDLRKSFALSVCVLYTL